MNRIFVLVTLTACSALLLTIGHSQTLPAPSVDRVGFPKGYDQWNLLYVLDRPDTKRILVTYGNDAAMSVRFGQQGNYPYGSIIAQETWRAILDALGEAVLDADGRFQRDPAFPPTVNVMRKEKGFGEEYKQLRNGEWEYGGYRLDGGTQVAPQNTGICANCHLQAGAGKDWIMRASLNFNGASGAAPAGVIKNYSFVPGVIRAKAGSIITIYNDDVIEHNIVDDGPGGWGSPRLRGGSSVALKFPNVPFEFNFHCSIHPAMRGKVILEP